MPRGSCLEAPDGSEAVVEDLVGKSARPILIVIPNVFETHDSILECANACPELFDVPRRPRIHVQTNRPGTERQMPEIAQLLRDPKHSFAPVGEQGVAIADAIDA